MSRIVLTGGRGAVAASFGEALGRAGHEALALGSRDLDVTDAAAVRETMRGLAPQVVIDCAMSQDLDEVPIGAQNVAAAAAAARAFIVYLSCADVFDGTQGPYVESDTPSPASDLGAAKLAAEQAVARATLNHAIVRTSWLYGPGRDDPVSAVLDESHDPVVADATVTASPTYLPHLADVVAALVSRPVHGVLHRAGRGGCTEVEFLRAALRSAAASGHRVTGEIGVNDALRDRTLASVRSEVHALPDWRLGLQAHLKTRVSRSCLRDR